jgi:hypothetical protein
MMVCQEGTIAHLCVEQQRHLILETLRIRLVGIPVIIVLRVLTAAPAALLVHLLGIFNSCGRADAE